MTGRDLRWLAGGAFAVALACLLLTSGGYGVASDVGNYFEASLRELAWGRKLVAAILAGEPSSALNREVVFEHWRWYLPRITHPPLSRELAGLGYVLLRGVLDPLTAYRTASMAAFSALVAGCGVLTAWALRSRVAGVAAALTLLVVPATFAYGHLALTDGLVTAFWFGSVAGVFVHVRTGRPGWLVLGGLLFGAAAATKFSGLLVLPVAAAWLLLRRHPRVASFVAFALLGVALFAVVNPVLWVDPMQGMRDYLEAGLQRSDQLVTRIATEYLGHIYEFRPPWHYPYVWTAIVLPLPILGAIAVGAASGGLSDHVKELVRLAALNVAVLYGALLWPAAPMHDGVRLLLPAFPFYALLAGIGTERLGRLAAARLPEGDSAVRRGLPATVLALVLLFPALRTLQYHPYQLSYFNALVGGVRGARARGLEVTSLKEVLNREVLDDLARAIPPGAVVDPGFFIEEVCFYEKVGWAPPEWIVESGLRPANLDREAALTCAPAASFPNVDLDRAPRDPEFVFVLNRKAQWRPLEWALYDYGEHPLYEVSLEGVPLMRVYRVE